MIAVILFFLLLYVNSLDTSAVVPVSYTEDGQHFTISFNLSTLDISGELLFHTNSSYTVVDVESSVSLSLWYRVVDVESPVSLSLCNSFPSWVENQGIQITADVCPEGSENLKTEEIEITPDLIDLISVTFLKFNCSTCDEHNFMGYGFISNMTVQNPSHDPPLNPPASWERGFTGLPLLPDGDDNGIIEFNIADEPFLRWTKSVDEYQWTESRYHYHESIPNVFEVYDFSTCNTSLTGNHMKAVIDTSNVCLRLPALAMKTLSLLVDCNWEEDANRTRVGCYFESKPKELPVLTFSLTQNGPLFGIPLEDLYIDSSDKLCVIQTSAFNDDKILFGTMALRAFSGVAFDYEHMRVGFPTSDLFESVYSSGNYCHEIPEASDLSCQSYILYDVDSDGKCIVDSTVVSTILGLTLTVFLLSSLNIGLRWLVEQNMTLTHA